MDPSQESSSTASSLHQNSSTSNYQAASSPLPPPPSSATSSSFRRLSPAPTSNQQAGDHSGARASSFSSAAAPPNPSLLRLGSGAGAAEVESDYARRGSAFASLGGGPALDGSGGGDQFRRGSQAAAAAYSLEHLVGVGARAHSVSAQGSAPSSAAGLPRSPNAFGSFGGNGQASALGNHHHLAAPTHSSSTTSSPLASHGRPAITRHSYSDGPNDVSSSSNSNSNAGGGPDALSAALASNSLSSYNSGGAFPPSPAPSQLSHASGSASMTGTNGLGYASTSTSNGLDGLFKSPHGSNLSFSSSGGPIPSSSQDPSLLLPVSTALHGPLSMSDPRTQLSISNLPYRVRWQDLKDLFRKAGTVLRADVALTQDNRSMGHGTVLMATEEDAHRACEMFRGFSWQGRGLDVNIDRSGTLLGPTPSGGPSPGLMSLSPHAATVNASPLAPSPIGNHASASPAGIGSSSFLQDQQRASSPNPSLYPFLSTGNGSTGSGGPGSASGSQHAGNHSHSHSSAESATGPGTTTTSFPNGIGGSSLPPPHGMQQQQQHSLQPAPPSGWGSAGGPTLGNGNQSSPMLGGGGGGAARQSSHIPSGWGKAATGGSNAPSQRGSIASQGGLGGFSQAQVQNAAQLQAQVAALHPYLQQALGLNAGNTNLNVAASGIYGANQHQHQPQSQSQSHPSQSGYGLSGASAYQNPGAGGYAYPATHQQAQQAQQHYALYQQHNQQVGPQSYYGRVLFVGNLPFHCQWQDLKDLFRAAGNIQRADVALGPEGRSRGFGTVLFASVEDAQNAVRIYHGYEYSGRTLKVHFDRFAQTMVPPGAGTPGTPSQYTAAFAATQPPSHVNHSNLKQKEPPAPPAQYNPQQQSHQQRLQHLYQQQQQHVQSQQQQVQQLQQQQQHQYQSRSRQQEQQMAQLGMSSGQGPQSFSAFGLPPTSQQSQWGIGQQQNYLGSDSSRSHSIDGSAPDTNQNSSGGVGSGGAPHPGRIAMPPSAFPGVMGAMSPMQMRMSVPMTPGMPGFTFQAIPQTPPLHPHFLSPGLGPFSPPLGGPMGSPHITGPGQLAGTHLQSGPPTPFANHFINAAPGAPLHQQMQNVTTPGAHGSYNPMFPMSGNGASYPPPTPHWSQPPRPQAENAEHQEEKSHGAAAAAASTSESTEKGKGSEESQQGSGNENEIPRPESHSPKMQDGYPFPVVSNQSTSLMQRRASTNSPAASPGGINIRNHLNESFSGAAERRGSIPSNAALQTLASSNPEELAKAIALMSLKRGTALSKEKEKHPLARENSDPNQTLSLESLRVQNKQLNNADSNESALSTSQGGTPGGSTESQPQGHSTLKEAFSGGAEIDQQSQS